MSKTIRHHYSDEEKEFLKKNIKGRSTFELTKMFNEKFDVDLKRSQIRSFNRNHGLTSGIITRFKKGHEPWSKGRSDLTGHKPTQFKKGHRPINAKPVGSEIVTEDGYKKVKVQEPNIWEYKHRITYREQKGAIPEGKALIFADQDKMNTDIENLTLVDRKELLIMNKKGLIHDDQELTNTGVSIARMYSKINELKRKGAN